MGVQPRRRAGGCHDRRPLDRSAPQVRLGGRLGHSMAAREPTNSAPPCTRCSTSIAYSAGSTPRPTDWPRRVRAARRKPDAPSRGARFFAAHEVARRPRTWRPGRRRAYRQRRVIRCRRRRVAAGFWGAQLAKQVGLIVPLVPMAHQYARTGQIAGLAGAATRNCRRRACRSCGIRTTTCISASTSTASASAIMGTGRCRWTCPR